MKKIIFAAAAALMMLIGTKANAQLYFGGSVAFSTTTWNDGQNQANSITSGTSFKFMPEVGFRINDRMAVGGTVGYMHGLAALGSLNPNDYKGMLLARAGMRGDQLSATNANGQNLGGQRVDGIRFAPYFRFSIVNSRRFDLFVDGVIGYSSISTQNLNAQNAWVEGPKYGLLEIGARPGFLVKFDGHFSIMAHIGSLGYQNISTTRINPDNSRTTSTIGRFGLDVDSANIMLGFIYSL